MIKCVFSGYEARLCSGVKMNTHEIRLHPYLFPVGLGGLPTFMEGGNPHEDEGSYSA
ncbi:1,3-beta-galactosyl-N-acetylhexosamine phosphorylase N-terminal domain-containing protein [Paenibacillus polymyxa]|uniref:1,3-beta-galactosyl-N-acetylhexosamine phosphorylase N-terminal domain-containing protein n=1 Tax=Paenibacillus polymyxa TaxID=1406 RepID=UPI00287F5BDB|nr:1,3-beta-galactosyl-N-acetylhexosamine phosphorylase N-terminal domain-containing protein [Paenibacillus polymyxa]